MFVDYNYTSILEDISQNGKFELYAILKVLENAGNLHSTKSGDNAFEATQEGHAWMLTDWYAEILDYPTYKDTIKVTTWSQPKDSLFTCFRDYEMFANDKLCVKGISKWASIDINTLRPLKIEDELYARYQPEDKCVFQDFKMPKIPMVQNFSLEKPLEVRRSDIDYNFHVHNLQYIVYAMECLPEDVYKNREFKHIHAAYKMAIMPEEKIVGKYAFEDGKHLINIVNQDGQLKTQIELY